MGSLALTETSGTGAPMRSTTTLIDDSGTCARASAAMTVGGSGPDGTRMRAFDFIAARGEACLCESALVPVRASAEVHVVATAAITIARVMACRQRPTREVGFFSIILRCIGSDQCSCGGLAGRQSVPVL
jgi:hypothetical protein